MKTKLAFIIPYIGKFPNYFQLWLNSCGWNPDFDWLIFTDDHTAYRYPQNVKVTYVTFDFLRNLAQNHFDFKISLGAAYKFCDLKPCYGKVFEDYLQGYDFWGYCDIDLVWGDLSKWITDAALQGIDRISRWGHCCLYRNTEKINSLYQCSTEGTTDFRKVLSSECNYLFDEEGGLQKICEAKNINTLEIPLFDVKADSLRFVPTCASTQWINQIEKDIIFVIQDGKVLKYSQKNHQLDEQEFAYVHFAKRKLLQEIDDSATTYMIVPNKFVDYIRPNLKLLRMHQPLVNIYFRFKYNLIKGKIDVLLGKNKVRWPNSRLQRISDFIHNKK